MLTRLSEVRHIYIQSDRFSLREACKADPILRNNRQRFDRNLNR